MNLHVSTDSIKHLPKDSVSDDVADMNIFFVKNRHNMKIAHLNINSVRHKFFPISNMLNKSIIDILFIQETKLDDNNKASNDIILMNDDTIINKAIRDGRPRPPRHQVGWDIPLHFDTNPESL